MVNTPLIFYGNDYNAIIAKAKSFAVNLLGRDNHPDFLELQIEGKSYIKEQITEFLSDVALTPYEAKHKVYLFPVADKMLPVHANALLKAFEEKPDHAVILLVTDNIKGVIETILSRCKKILVAETKGEITPNVTMIKALNHLANKDLYACLDLIPELEEIDLDEIGYTLLTWCRDLNTDKLEMVHSWVTEAHKASERHTRSKLILEYLLLKPFVAFFA